MAKHWTRVGSCTKHKNVSAKNPHLTSANPASQKCKHIQPISLKLFWGSKLCVCHPFFSSLTNGTPQEWRTCQHIPQPRLYLKQWHKTKRLIVFWSKHTGRRLDITRASFLIPPDHTRGSPWKCSSQTPMWQELTQSVGRFSCACFAHVPSSSFHIMTTGYSKMLYIKTHFKSWRN